jgi:hypothetical protein
MCDTIYWLTMAQEKRPFLDFFPASWAAVARLCTHA